MGTLHTFNKTLNMKYNTVLTIAGSDSGGGAGIQADIKTISANGCYATSAITAVTAQNTKGVFAIHPVPPSSVEAQIHAVLTDIGSDAVKIGMLHHAETVRIVASSLDKYLINNSVLDPVMISTSGKQLLQNDAIEVLKELLIPKVRILTPNIPEAELLLNKALESAANMASFAQELSQKYGHISILLKAGHAAGEMLTDVFYNAESDEITELKAKRISSQNTHGTGCTLSAALAAQLAKGKELNEAAIAAKDYINEAIIAGKDYEIGRGRGPVKHFYKYW